MNVRRDGSVGAAALAAAFGVNIKTIHNWCDPPSASGRRTAEAMPHWKTVGGHFRFDPRQVVAWAEASQLRVPQQLRDAAAAASVAVPAPKAAA